MKTYRFKTTFRIAACFIILAFSINLIIPTGVANAQSPFNLPQPGTMVTTSPAFVPPMLSGLIIYPENPFQFDFIVDSGNKKLNEDELKSVSSKLIRYFLASLAIPENDLWVNLSPYEKDRIIPDAFGKTEMGMDLLAQDYMLKQLTASLMYPETALGSEFWNKIYEQAQEKFGTTEIPVNTLNKVWIVPERAEIFENKDRIFVVSSHLKVLLEEDYLAMESSLKLNKPPSSITVEQELSSSIIREVIIPAIEKEVNEGKNFAQLRQIYNSFILAAWYKKNLKQSILNQAYSDKERIDGIELEDKNIKDDIYKRYLTAFKSGVFDFIKEDYDEKTQEVIPRKYFSGGAVVKDVSSSVTKEPTAVGDLAMASVRLDTSDGQIFEVSTTADSYEMRNSELTGLGVDVFKTIMGAWKAHDTKVDPKNNTRLNSQISELKTKYGFRDLPDREYPSDMHALLVNTEEHGGVRFDEHAQAFELQRTLKSSEFGNGRELVLADRGKGFVDEDRDGIPDVLRLVQARHGREGSSGNIHLGLSKFIANMDEVILITNGWMWVKGRQPFFTARSFLMPDTSGPFRARWIGTKLTLDELPSPQGTLIIAREWENHSGYPDSTLEGLEEWIDQLNRSSQAQSSSPVDDFEKSVGDVDSNPTPLKTIKTVDFRKGIEEAKEWMASRISSLPEAGPLVIFVTGAPGTGKSTVVGLIKNELNRYRQRVDFYDQRDLLTDGIDALWKDDFKGSKGVVVIESVGDIPSEWWGHENLLMVHVKADAQMRMDRIVKRGDNISLAGISSYYDYTSYPDIEGEIIVMENNLRIDDLEHTSEKTDIKKGGIDFNPEHLDMQSHGQKVDLPLPINIDAIGNIEINGLIPFILKVTPLADLPLLLGKENPPEDGLLSLRN